MRRLTLQEVNEQHDGFLPPDATLKPDDEPERPALPEPAKRHGRPARPPNAKRRGRPGKRWEALNAFVDFALAKLTGAETKVWLILFRDTKAETGTARTGQADIARRTGLSGRGVKKTVRSLQAKGFLEVVRRGRLHAGPSIYRVHPTGSHGAL